MCKLQLHSILKKLLLFVLVFFVLPLYCSAADTYVDVTEEFLPSQTVEQSSTQSSNSSNQNMTSSSSSTSSSAKALTEQEVESMNAWECLDNLDKIIENYELKLEMQSSLLSSSDKELQNTKQELINSKLYSKQLREALASNKTDTSEVIKVAGEIQERLNYLETRIKRSHLFTNISFPTMLAAGAVTGIGSYMLYKGVYDHDSTMIKTGGIMMAAGGCVFLGFEITYNIGGSTKIKIW